jgi:tetratricopeptide (TPR) repeat protein
MARRGVKNRPRDADNRRQRIARQEAAVQIGKPTGTAATVLAVCILLVLAVTLVFAQSAGHAFVNFDDPEYVQDNPHVNGGVTAEGIDWSFHFHNANWHPLTWLSHMVDCQLFGVKRAAGHHLTAVLLHIANTLLLFLVLRNMTADLWPAAFAAALFGIHPLHVESVAWVAERKDVLSTLFFILSLAAYVGYARRPFSIARYLLVTLLFALGLMAKPMLVTLPFVFLLLDYWPLARTTIRSASEGKGSYARVLLQKLPWLALSAISCVITYYAQAATESVWEQLPLSARVANALVSCVGYLRQLVYPAGLAAFYPHPQGVAPAWRIAGSLLLLGGITFICVASRRKSPCLIVGWLWYLGMLVPVIGLVQVGAQAMADRYTYLPQIGLYIAVAWGVAQLVKLRTIARSGWRAPELAMGMVSALVLAALTIVAWRQTAYWKDGIALWSRVVACTSPNSWPHNSLGRALAESGKINEAADQFRQALAIDPNDDFAHSNLGIALARSNKVEDVDEAIEHFQSVLRIKRNDELTQGNLGSLLLRRGRVGEAIQHLQAALRLDPNDPVARANLAAALAAQEKSANP